MENETKSDLDWSHIRATKYSDMGGPKDWPPGLRTISMNGLSLFAIDSDNQLFWDGQKILVEKRLRLEWWQTCLATITAFAAFTVATIEVGRSAGWWL
ncbi:MAG: hypothetical protein CMM78_04820 [Rhodospirillaceae bacterium]|nr:hypothetical protein [Rhodospirillales bacterium]MAX47510.1 hypothetical protein [Rhodospirillaceae bacterium]|tara:strand:+ start:363 stop:656 length:294 start_codon:yes stop_codon:yes gene_type:complete